MRYNLKLGIAAIAGFAMFTACKNNGGSGFDTDASSGIQYHFYNHNDKGARPSIGDYAEVILTLKNANDSVIYDAHHKRRKEDSGSTVKLHLNETFKGCLPDGITLMAIGDSASFKVSADSLYLKTFHASQLPSFIKSGSMVTFYIKLVGFETPQLMADAMDSKIKERREMMDKRKADEQTEIAKYIADNKVTVKPDSDGIYILERKKGKGKPVKMGDSVEVKYTGMLLDGTVVETSNHGSGNTTFTLVYGKDYFIKGFDDIIKKLENGGSVKALIPSALAYGEQKQSELIMPCTPLLYSVEIISVK
jgi:FKBP-type peptidyl-prolyl cis-trans isomerase FkpA